MLYPCWLLPLSWDVYPDAEEPMPGIGPLTPELEAFADFFLVDPDLLAAAAERPAPSGDTQETSTHRRTVKDLQKATTGIRQARA